jgi:hypothetical protein
VQVFRTQTPINDSTPSDCLEHHLELVETPVAHGEGCHCVFIDTVEDAWEHWHQRSRALEELLMEIVRLAPRPWMQCGASWMEWDALLTKAEKILKGANDA